MDAFAALADPVRRDLLRALAAGPVRVVDLAAGRSISRPAISKHLRLLTQAGLASVEERGRERHYRLTPSGLEPVQGLLGDLLGELRVPVRVPESAFDALDLEVRRTVRDHRGAESARPAPPTEETA